MGAIDCVCVQRSYDHSFLGVIDNHATQICGVLVLMDNIHSLTTNADDFSRIGLRRFSSLLVRLCPLRTSYPISTVYIVTVPKLTSAHV